MGGAARDWADLEEAQAAPLYDRVFDLARVGPGTRLVDAGCGSGAAARRAVDRGARVTGFDLSPALVDLARKRVPEGRFFVGSVDDSGLVPGSFDVVTAFNALQFAADPRIALEGLSRLGVDGGVVGIGITGPPDTVRIGQIFSAVMKLLPPSPRTPSPLSLQGAGVLEEVAESAGLDVVETGEVNAPYRWPNLDTAVRAQASAGPVAELIARVGEDIVLRAFADVLADNVAASGEVLLHPNVFRFILARRAHG